MSISLIILLVQVSSPALIQANVEAERSVAPAISVEASVNWQRVGGTVVTAAGLAAAVWGGALIYRGNDQANIVQTRLPNGPAISAVVRGRDPGDIRAGNAVAQRGRLTAMAGGAVALAGIVLVIAAPTTESHATLAPWMTSEAAGLTLSGVW